MEEHDYFNILLIFQFRGQLSFLASFLGCEVFFQLSVRQLFLSSGFLHHASLAAFLPLAVSHDIVNCGVHGGNVIKPGRRAAWQRVSDPR